MEHILDKLDPKVLGENLKNARVSLGLRQEDVATHLGVARTTLVAVEKGERRVKARELAVFASLYRRDLSEWLKDAPAPIPFAPQFRLPSGKRLDAESLADAVRKLEQLSQDYSELEQITKRPMARKYPPPYSYEVPGVTVEQRGEDIAAEERLRLGIGDGPIADLRSLLEFHVGLRVFYYTMPSQVGGIYAFREDLGACIAINRAHPAARNIWSLAHEYGHFLSTRQIADVSFWDDEGWGKMAAERFADAFARHFLMPRVGVNRCLNELVAAHGKGITAGDVLTLAHVFCVSVEAMFRRLEDLRRLPVGTWDGLKSQKFQPDKARETLGMKASENREEFLPFRYRMLAREAFDSLGEMTEAQLARYLRMDLVAARQELQRLRAIPDRPGEDEFEIVDVDPNDVIVSS